eukprot:PhF_6_TR9071/c0_g1_i1/m.14138
MPQQSRTFGRRTESASRSNSLEEGGIWGATMEGGDIASNMSGCECWGVVPDPYVLDTNNALEPIPYVPTGYRVPGMSVVAMLFMTRFLHTHTMVIWLHFIAIGFIPLVGQEVLLRPEFSPLPGLQVSIVYFSILFHLAQMLEFLFCCHSKRWSARLRFITCIVREIYLCLIVGFSLSCTSPLRSHYEGCLPLTTIVLQISSSVISCATSFVGAYRETTPAYATASAIISVCVAYGSLAITVLNHMTNTMICMQYGVVGVMLSLMCLVCVSYFPQRYFWFGMDCVHHVSAMHALLIACHMVLILFLGNVAEEGDCGLLGDHKCV